MRREDREREQSKLFEVVVKNEGASRGHGKKLYFSFFPVSHVARFEVRPGVTVCKVNLNVLIGCGGF